MNLKKMTKKICKPVKKTVKTVEHCAAKATHAMIDPLHRRYDKGYQKRQAKKTEEAYQNACEPIKA